MKAILVLAAAIWFAASLAAGQSSVSSDEGAHVLALDNSWNRALETNDTKALDLLLADSFVSIDIDGSMQNKRQFLASLKDPGYQPPAHAVTEESNVNVYGDSAVVVGGFPRRPGEKAKRRRGASALSIPGAESIVRGDV